MSTRSRAGRGRAVVRRGSACARPGARRTLRGMDIWPDVSCEYDEGYFDKDEQGWCARCCRVTQEGPEVTLRAWGDDNGARPYESTSSGVIEAVIPELGLVRLGGGLAGTYVDLKTRRLRSNGEQELYHGAAWPGYIEPEGLARVIDLLATIHEALTGSAAPRPEPPTWPPLTPSTTWQGALGSVVARDEGPFQFRFSRNHDPRSGEPYMTVGMSGAGASVYMHVNPPATATLVVSGSIERRGEARAVCEGLGYHKR